MHTHVHMVFVHFKWSHGDTHTATIHHASPTRRRAYSLQDSLQYRLYKCRRGRQKRRNRKAAAERAQEDHEHVSTHMYYYCHTVLCVAAVSALLTLCLLAEHAPAAAPTSIHMQSTQLTIGHLHASSNTSNSHHLARALPLLFLLLPHLLPMMPTRVFVTTYSGIDRSRYWNRSRAVRFMNASRTTPVFVTRSSRRGTMPPAMNTPPRARQRRAIAPASAPTMARNMSTACLFCLVVDVCRPVGRRVGQGNVCARRGWWGGKGVSA